MPHQANTKETTEIGHLSETPYSLQMAVILRSTIKQANYPISRSFQIHEDIDSTRLTQSHVAANDLSLNKILDGDRRMIPNPVEMPFHLGVNVFHSVWLEWCQGT